MTGGSFAHFDKYFFDLLWKDQGPVLGTDPLEEDHTGVDSAVMAAKGRLTALPWPLEEM